MISWQSEEEELLPEQEDKPFRARRAVTHLLILLLLLAFALPGTIWGFRQWQVYHTSIARDAIQERYLQLREAAILRDEALFAERVGEGGLTRQERALLSEQSWWDRGLMGLSWRKTSTPVISVTLSAHGREAELIALEPYAPEAAGEGMAPVFLAHTMIFRWETDQWVYSPPGDSAGESKQVTERQYLRLNYPVHDTELAERLADDLNILIDRVCTELDDIRCPPHYRPEIELSGEPAALLIPAGKTTSAALLRLPAPGLTGHPFDEEAYAALLEGYARLLIPVVMADLVDWNCCAGQLFFHVLLDYQLRELGLPPTLPDKPNYAHLVRRNVEPNNLFGLWDLPPENVRPETMDRARAVVGFLLAQEPEVSIAEWQRRLATGNEYQDWVAALAFGNAPAHVRAAWLSYLQGQVGVTENRIMNEPPEQDILLICDDEAARPQEDDAHQVWRYTPQDDQMRPELPGRTFNTTNLLATEENGILLLEVARRQATKLYALDAGTAQIIWEPEIASYYTWWRLGPLGDHLFVRPLFRRAGVSQSALLDVNSCLQGSCLVHALPRGVFFPAWSPDEQHFLFIEDDALYLGNSQTMMWEKVAEVPASGYYEPLWVDNEHFAYILMPESSQSISLAEWVPQVTRIGEHRPEPLFDPAVLRRHLPALDEDPDWLSVNYNPNNPEQLYIRIEFRKARRLVVLTLDRRTGAIEMLLEIPSVYGAYPVLSPNGRWLSFNREGQLVFFHTDTRQTTEIEGVLGAAPAVWSPDSEWVLTLNDNALLLARPATGESHVYVDQQRICSQAVWSVE